ncbi:MAG: S4 domain-containing protein [Owenweeksia sp.]|nr:S4 domain-containing protein [Owenweeksia sp.]
MNRGKKPEPGRPPRGKNKTKESNTGLTRLNKYLSNAGVSSRREADNLIKAGLVQVNGKPLPKWCAQAKARRPGEV